MIDTVFRMLSSTRRRYVLQHVASQRTTNIKRATKFVARQEHENPTDMHRKAAYVSLYQTHLPKLDAAELLNYDEDDGAIERSMYTGHAATYIAQAKEQFE